MRGLLWVAVCISMLGMCIGQDSGSFKMKVEHSLDGIHFQERGSLSFKPPSSFMNPQAKLLSRSVRFEQYPLSFTKQEFMAHPFYQIRILTHRNETIYASVSTKSLVESDFHDQLFLQVNRLDHIIGLSVLPRRQTQNELKGELKFKTKVIISAGTDSTKAKPVDYVQKESGQSESWFSKYVCTNMLLHSKDVLFNFNHTQVGIYRTNTNCAPNSTIYCTGWK